MKRKNKNQQKMRISIIALLFLLSIAMITPATTIITDTGITTNTASFQGDVAIAGLLSGTSALKVYQTLMIETDVGTTLTPVQLLVKNINNGTLASSNMVVENDIGNQFGLGLASSQGVFAEGINQASLFYIGDNVMLFSIVSNQDRGWIWKHADISQFPNITSSYQMKLNSSGDLWIDGNATINDVIHLTPRTTPPSNPSEGDIYVNSVEHVIYCYLDGEWANLN